jgi:hypothetical protein
MQPIVQQLFACLNFITEDKELETVQETVDNDPYKTVVSIGGNYLRDNKKAREFNQAIKRIHKNPKLVTNKELVQIKSFTEKLLELQQKALDMAQESEASWVREKFDWIKEFCLALAKGYQKIIKELEELVGLKTN